MSDKMAAVELAKLVSQFEKKHADDKTRQYWFELFLQCQELMRVTEGVVLPESIEQALEPLQKSHKASAKTQGNP